MHMYMSEPICVGYVCACVYMYIVCIMEPIFVL